MGDSARMYAETSEKKMSHARIAFALLCGLAVCCSVMYITADGDEYVHEIVSGHGDEATGAAYDAGTSVGSTDVLKAGQIYTETPEGRMRLMDYFNNVEKKIADEITNRKADIATVRAQMARDFAFNAAARAKLKKEMLTKMAVNAKIARDNLDREMRKTQEHFAKNAAFNNRRYKASLKRDKKTKELIEQDKRRAAKQLKLAVTSWQKNTNAWAAATNARIDQMNAHVAANAAQIKENAKKARKDLEVAMGEWDHKVATFRTESATARNKLSEQFKAQDKATRAWASNKIKGMVASTAAQFNDVETHMAKNRHEVDMALRQATMRFEAALNAAQALEDKRYAESVANIQAAKVDANVNAEMTHMIKLGNKRYTEHLKDDAELQNLIAKDKSETDDKLNKMAESFNAALASVRKELAADRKHAEDSLKKSTSAVWAKLQANQAEQAKKNAEMEAATRRMRLDAMDAVREAKAAFRKKIADLGEIVAENDKKADAKIKHLTGVVGEEAEKSRQGREELAALEDANKKELKKAINDAIATGETLAPMNKEARDQMKAEMLYAIRTAAEVAKADLDIAVRNGVKKMIAFQAKSAEVHATAAAGRADLKAEIAANAKEIADEIQGAVAADAAAQKALGDETSKAIEKTNKDITAYSDQMRAIALKTRADIKATNEKTLAAIKQEEERANGAIENFTAEDAARQEEAR